jgi:hypothetical protein
MDRQPATFDVAAAAVAAADRRSEARIVADAVHSAGYLIPTRLPGRLRRGVAARLVRDGLALLHLAGGGPTDVLEAAVDLDLYRRPDDDPRAVADRAAAHAAGRAADDQSASPELPAAGARPDPFRDPAFLDAEYTNDD